MSAQQQAEAQRQANKANQAISDRGFAQSERQFDASTGELSLSRREREDDINRQIQERFEGLRQENLGRLSPYGQAGQAAVTEQQALMGLSGADAEAEAYKRISESPGQQFLRERQERALLRNQAALGGLGGGNVRTALQEQAYGRAQTAIDDRVQQLGALSGQGLTASQTAAQISQAPGYVTTGADLGVRYAATPEGKAEAAEAARVAAEAEAARVAALPRYTGRSGGYDGGGPAGGVDVGGLDNGFSGMGTV